MNFVEQNTAPFPTKPIPKKLKIDSQAYAPTIIHELPEGDHKASASQIQGLQQTQQRIQFNFENLRNCSIKIQSHSMSKEKTFEYIRDNFQHLEESEVQNLYQEIKHTDSADDKGGQECSNQQQQQMNQLKMSDANKVAQRQMQQLQQRGSILARYQTDFVNSKYNMSNSQLKFKLPPKASNQPGQMPSRIGMQQQRSRMSKKRGLDKTFLETQQQNSMQLENQTNQFQTHKNIQMANVSGNQQQHRVDSPPLSELKMVTGANNQHQQQQSSQQQILMSSTNDSQVFPGGVSSSQSDSQQINIDSPKSTVENNQINQQQHQALKYNLQIAKDRFFTSLENNLMQFINDRNAAYSFITKELNIYDDETLVTMNQILNTKDLQKQSAEVLQREINILQKGVRLFNTKYTKLQSHTNNLKSSLMLMQTKLQEKELENQKLRQEKERSGQNQPNFQMFQNLKAAYENQAREIEQLRAQNQFLLKSLIPEPHVNNHHPFGGHNGGNFDGSGHVF